MITRRSLGLAPAALLPVAAAAPASAALFPAPVQYGDEAADTVCVLSVDGGGLRGIAAARLLQSIDEVLRRRSGTRLVDCFDVFAGTSTGSIIAAGLAGSKGGGLGFGDPARIVDVYRQQASRIFGIREERRIRDPSTQRWLSSGLEGALNDVFGDMTLSQVTGELIIPYYNMCADLGRSATIAHGGPPGVGDPPWDNVLVREVVQASCSAPTYFNPMEMSGGQQGVDGGVFANNPAMVAWTAVQRRRRGARVVMLSVGCGHNRAQYDQHDTWGAIEWMNPTDGVPLIDVLMRGRSDLVDSQMAVVLDPDQTYFRFQFAIDGLSSQDMDDSSSRNLNELVALAEGEARNPGTAASIERLADALATVQATRSARAAVRR